MRHKSLECRLEIVVLFIHYPKVSLRLLNGAKEWSHFEKKIWDDPVICHKKCFCFCFCLILKSILRPGSLFHPWNIQRTKNHSFQFFCSLSGIRNFSGRNPIVFPHTTPQSFVWFKYCALTSNSVVSLLNLRFSQVCISAQLLFLNYITSWHGDREHLLTYAGMLFPITLRCKKQSHCALADRITIWWS